MVYLFKIIHHTEQPVRLLSLSQFGLKNKIICLLLCQQSLAQTAVTDFDSERQPIFFYGTFLKY